MIYQSVNDVDFSLADLPSLPTPGRVLLTSPLYFAVEYVINPHMEGNIGDVDLRSAISQWTDLGDIYRALGFDVHLQHGVSGLPDMVFCANQTLPFLLPGDEKPGVILSSMHSSYRQPEVASYELFFKKTGYDVVELPDKIRDFEGMGDALWHPGRRLLYGGHGFRSSIEAYDFISSKLDVPVVTFELNDPDFYHLDTCLSLLNENTCLIFPGAFEPAGRELIGSLFETVIEAPENESRGLFAVNAHCPDGHHVIIQDGCHQTNSLLAEAGFLPISTHTEEFLKSGGSVFCMKQMFW
ncbi:MAG: amidinotransferase [Rhodothermales bacterium]|nr:amidinotransferase [Rhodothermales bacterium]